MVVLMRGFQIEDSRNVEGAFGGDSAGMKTQARRSRPEAPPTFCVPCSRLRRIRPSAGRLLLLIGLLSPAASVVTCISLRAEQPTREIKVKARRFKFVPSRIKVEAGTTLEIVLSSQDVKHGFKIVGTDIDVEIPARGKVRVTFKPDKAGQYRFECSRVCGAGHASMRGVIQVAEPKQNKPEAGPEERGKRE